MKQLLPALFLFFCASLIHPAGQKFQIRKTTIRVEDYPDDKGLFISQGRCSFSVAIYFSLNYDIREITQSKCLSWSDTDPEGNVAAQAGKNLEFHPNGKIAKSIVHAGIGSFHAMQPTFCDVEMHYDETGKKIFEKKHQNKCLQGRAIYRFFLPPGEYYVTEPPLRLRAAPDQKAKTIANLDKDEKVEVLDYTTERLEIKGSYAPWAKVKTAKGEGWVYGAYIEPVNYGETYKKFFQNIDWKAFAEKMGLE